MKTTAIIEIPKGSNYKYEVSKDTGFLVLDRVVNQEIPYNYGFIPHTLCGDGDPLDIFILSSKPIPPLTQVTVELVGVFICDDNGSSDDKLIGLLVGEDPSQFDTTSIETYLKTYKTGFQILKVLGSRHAKQVLENSKTHVSIGGMSEQDS